MYRKKERRIKERLGVLHEEKFPSDIDDRLMITLPTLNGEQKQVIMLLMGDEPKTQSMIRDDFIEIFPYGFDESSIFKDYCRKTLVGSGFVKEEEVITNFFRRSCRAWSSTEAGELLGKPISAFTLSKAREYGRSFFKVLGSAHSSWETNAPYNRMMTLDILYRGNSLSVPEIAGILRVHPAAVRRHMKRLKELGFIDYVPGYSAKKVIPGGENLLKDWFYRVRDALEGGKEIKHMREICSRYENHSGMFSEDALLEVSEYMNVSPSRRKNSFSEACQKVERIISDLPGMCCSEIECELGATPFRYLQALEDSEIIYSEKRGNKRLFWPAKAGSGTQY